eukprot:SAG31_NODE_536_length_14340_cov_9.449196_15_plen_150_part_00
MLLSTAAGDSEAFRKIEWQSHPRAAVAVTLLQQRKCELSVLLARRANPPSAGCWSLPGGKIEPGEPALLAAEREIAEETGLVSPEMVMLHPECITCSDAIHPPDFHYLIAQYVGWVTPGAEIVAGDDAAELEWFSMRDMCAPSTPYFLV